MLGLHNVAFGRINGMATLTGCLTCECNEQVIEVNRFGTHFSISR